METSGLNNTTLKMVGVSTRQAQELLLRLLEMSKNADSTDDIAANVAATITAATVYVATVCHVIHEMLTYGLEEQEKKNALQKLANLVGMGLTSLVLAKEQGTEMH
jgi:hypothetical protein